MLGLSWLVVFMHSQTWEHFCSIDEDWKVVQRQMVCASLWCVVWILVLMLKLKGTYFQALFLKR